jgi:hypothetical protein
MISEIIAIAGLTGIVALIVICYITGCNSNKE